MAPIARSRFTALLLALASVTACEKHTLPDVSLAFESGPGRVRRISLDELASHAKPTIVTTFDPYYGGEKRFRALPVSAVVSHGFGLSREAAAKRSYVLRAADGYAVPITGARLLSGDAYLAYDDVDVPGFAPIGPRQVDPAPFYLVWSGSARRDLESHPRPWQLETITVARLDALYAHVAPTGEPEGSPAHRGYELVTQRCLRCHAINREGGRVGPELNVPKSVVEYWSDEQLRAYVRDPRTFRYGAMPPNTDLSDADLDAIVAYLHAMSSRKYDEGEGPR